MDPSLDGAVMRATVVLLAGGLSLVAAGTAGVGGSFLLFAALAALAVALRLAAGALDDPSDDGLGLHTVATDLWIGPALAAALVALQLDATAGEVQALGGLVGMLNYFLRPLYHLVYALARRLGVA
ncbi:hypothetical protein [Halosimplex salinum]|uniref:hypothetical protein n=1 Tax=Halosimplex salinum TaxID=1710538 RepID=UPI000F49364A|nr:hypothetical protein [Halosimplex salinum]